MTPINFRPVLNAAGRPWLYRSANLDTISIEVITRLRALGINRVIDLRSSQERLALPAVLSEQISVINQPLYATDAPPALGNISEVYRGLTTQGGSRIAQAVGHIAQNTEGLSLAHCAVGKDRTGIVVALASLAVGIDPDAVVADYSASGAHVSQAFGATVRKRLDGLDIDEATRAASLELHLQTPAHAIEQVIDFVSQQYGSARNYLLGHGLTEADLNQLQERFEHPVTQQPFTPELTAEPELTAQPR